MQGMAVYGIAHVQIPIPIGGEDAARSFYGAVLGMPEFRNRIRCPMEAPSGSSAARRRCLRGRERRAGYTASPGAADGRSEHFAGATRAGRVRSRLWSRGSWVPTLPYAWPLREPNRA